MVIITLLLFTLFYSLINKRSKVIICYFCSQMNILTMSGETLENLGKILLFIIITIFTYKFKLTNLHSVCIILSSSLQIEAIKMWKYFVKIL